MQEVVKIQPQNKEQNLQKLRKFDFTKLQGRQKILINQLSTMTFADSFVKLLKNQYGGINTKQRFIQSNRVYLDSNQLADINQQTLNFKGKARESVAIIIGTTTFSSFILGLCMLPARKSPIRYTVGGFGLGLMISYGFWRLQLNRYENKVNNIFRKIVRDQFIQTKQISM